jgi:hypothetical protein
MSRTGEFEKCTADIFDSLRDGRSGIRSPVRAKFSLPFHSGPKPAQPTVQWISFSEVKHPERGADHPYPFTYITADRETRIFLVRAMEVKENALCDLNINM